MLAFKNKMILNISVFGISQSTEQDNDVKHETTLAFEKIILRNLYPSNLRGQCFLEVKLLNNYIIVFI